LVGQELAAVALQHAAGEAAAADHEHRLVVLLELLHQGDEVAVAAHHHEGIDVGVVDGHFQRIQRQIDVGAVLVAAGGQVTLDHVHGILGQGTGQFTRALPVAIGNFGNDFAALLERFQHHGQVKVAIERAAHADLDVVEVDEDRDFQFFFVHVVFTPRIHQGRLPAPGRSAAARQYVNGWGKIGNRARQKQTAARAPKLDYHKTTALGRLSWEAWPAPTTPRIWHWQWTSIASRRFPTTWNRWRRTKMPPGSCGRWWGCSSRGCRITTGWASI